MVIHYGHCHCEGVRFEFQGDEDLLAWECNCSICSMKRNTHVIVPGNSFRITTGEDLLTTYQFNTCTAKHMFCRVCGVQPFYVPRSNPDGYAITIYCIRPGTYRTVQVKQFNGRDWEGSYAATNIKCLSQQ